MGNRTGSLGSPVTMPQYGHPFWVGYFIRVPITNKRVENTWATKKHKSASKPHLLRSVLRVPSLGPSFGDLVI